MDQQHHSAIDREIGCQDVIRLGMYDTRSNEVILAPWEATARLKEVSSMPLMILRLRTSTFALPMKLSEEIRDLRQTLELMDKRRASRSMPGCFSKWIEDTLSNEKVTQVTFSQYNGKRKAQHHITAFKVKIKLVTFNEALWCRVFTTTFQGKVVSWYTWIPTSSVDSWAQFKVYSVKSTGQ